MRTKQILLFGLVTCSLTGNMACKDADSEKTLCIDNVRMISRVTGDPLPGDTLLNPNNTGPDFDVYGTDLGLMWHMDGSLVYLRIRLTARTYLKRLTIGIKQH